MSETVCRSRIEWLDGWRGIACYLMIAYHLLFDFMMFGWLPWNVAVAWPVVVWQKMILFSFILCAGWSASISARNVRRGQLVSGAGLLVVGASYIVGAPIRFGVLQFLGLAILLYAFAGRWVSRVPEKIAPVLWLGLFVLSWIGLDGICVGSHWLFWLGFPYDGFVSYDYVPLLPNVFLFLFGAWMGRASERHREQLPALETAAPVWLTWPGKRTLWIYLLHQPVLYGVCAAIYMFF